MTLRVENRPQVPMATQAEEPAQSIGFFDSVGKAFWDLYDWVGGLFGGGAPVKSYELTPEQKRRIEEIFYEAFNQWKEIDQGIAKEEVANFLHLLKMYYKRQHEIRTKEAQTLHENYEFHRKKVQEFQEKERNEYEQMLKDAGASNFWGKLCEALLPIYCAIAALALPPGVNVAVIAVCLVLAAELLSDHGITHAIAELAAGGDRDQEELLKSRMQLAVSLVNYGMAIPLSQGAALPIAVMFGLAKAGTGIGQTVSNISAKQHQARGTELKNIWESNNRKLLSELDQLKKVSEADSRAVRETLQMIETQNKIISSIFNQGG